MKNLIFVLSLLFSVAVTAQSTFENAMTQKLLKLETAQTPEALTALSNDFSRIADKEKTEWLPYYYAAYATIEKGRLLMRGGKTGELDAITNEAQKSLDNAAQISANNAELYILQKMIHGLRMMVDPQARFMTEAKLGADALAKAEQLDPENPRISLLKAEDTYYTPEQFGGSKTKGLELFQKSADQFKSYQPKTNLYPNWGKGEAEYFLANKP